MKMDVEIVITPALKGNITTYLSIKDINCGIIGSTHADLCQTHILRSFERTRNAAIVTGET